MSVDRTHAKVFTCLNKCFSKLSQYLELRNALVPAIKTFSSKIKKQNFTGGQKLC